MSTSTMNPLRLTPEQVEVYTCEGFLIVPDPIFPNDKFEKLVAHFDTKLAALPPGTRPEGMDVPHLTDPALFEWLFAPEVLDLVEPILGPDLALYSSHFICKPTGDGRRVPWHEDSAYWKGRMSPMKVVTVWLAIDDSTPENGCMHVIPRSHNTGMMGFSDYDEVDIAKNVFPTEITPAQRRDESRAVPCILQRNHASLHDARLIHGSPPNHSQKRRCGYTMRFISTDCLLSAEAREFHQIYLARGRDLAGNIYADPTRSYPELLEKRKLLGRKDH